MKVLIFGSGFIAKNFIDFWKKKYASSEIVVIYNRHSVKLKGVNNYKFDELSLKSFFDSFRPDYLVCCQGNSFVSDNKLIKDAIDNNVLKISQLLEFIYTNKASIRKILVIGSAGEYGKQYDNPIDENTPLLPSSPYGLSKVLLYNIAMYFCRVGLPIVYLRQFNTVGIGQQDKFVLPSFTKQVVFIEKGLQEKKIVVGDLTQERDFIDIKDTCRAYELLLQQGKAGEVYNIGSGKYISIRDLLNRIIEHSFLKDEEILIETNKEKLNNTSLSKKLYADTTKLRNLGFKPKFSLDSTIEDMLGFWRSNV